jgi:hypothetical protein
MTQKMAESESSNDMEHGDVRSQLWKRGWSSLQGRVRQKMAEAERNIEAESDEPEGGSDVEMSEVGMKTFCR